MESRSVAPGLSSGRLERAVGWLFGSALCLLSVLVVAEVVMRKFFLVSLQGVDELSGYVLAATASLAFFMALMDRAHMRIDIFYSKLPPFLRLGSDGLAVMAMAAGACVIWAMGWITFAESREFNSVSQTPWATPMVIPQGVWLVTLLPFVGLAVVGWVRWVRALIRGDERALSMFRAKGSEDELREQLQAIDARASDLRKEH